MKEKTKVSGFTYYSYIVVYVDDILCIDADLREIMDKITSIYRMKEDSIGPPKIYLGANVKKWSLQDENGTNSECWETSSESYAREEIRIVEGLMKEY